MSSNGCFRPRRERSPRKENESFLDESFTIYLGKTSSLISDIFVPGEHISYEHSTFNFFLVFDTNARVQKDTLYPKYFLSVNILIRNKNIELYVHFSSIFHFSRILENF